MTYRAPSGAPSTPTPPQATTPRRRLAQAFLLVVAVALLAAASATADPGTVASKEAQAQSVLGQIDAININLDRAVEQYNLANVRLKQIRGSLRDNTVQLNAARLNLQRSEKALARRLVTAYTSGEQDSTLAVVLGATSLDDLFNKFETLNSTSKQDTKIVRDVTTAKAAIQRHRLALQRAQTEQQQVVAERAAERQHIQSQLADRRQLLSSIRGEITHLKAEEAARQLQLAQQARARMAASTTGASALAGIVGVAASTPEGSTYVPPNVHSAVVSIAMRYLGVPYVWAGASPSGFDCSGLVMYVFAQIGISLPHSSYAQFNMGTPVSMSQLEPGDLVFFAGASHVGIYIGGGQFIHAPHTGDVVKISSLTGWYASEFAGGRRI